MIDEEKLLKYLEDERAWNYSFISDAKTTELVMKYGGRISAIQDLISKIRLGDFKQLTEAVK